MTRSIEIVAADDRTLAGTLHLPPATPTAAVLMVPGSGPSARDNGGYFPPIQSGLLAAGIAAASFDKRGVGGSAGDWRETGPAQQAADVAAQLRALRSCDELLDVPIGLFGHSQGGWVVLDGAASDASVPFVVANSGPGVTWARQGRYATARRLAAEGVPPHGIEEATRHYDEVMGLIRGGADFATVRAATDATAIDGESESPADPLELELIRAWLDHDPRVALEQIHAPILAIFGRDDVLVPVEDSAEAFRSALAGRSESLTVVVFDRASHRLLVGDPPALHPDYLPTLVGWIRQQAVSHR